MKKISHSSNLNKPLAICALSLIVGFFADIKCINWALVYGGFVSEGLMNILYPIVILFVVLFSLAASVRSMKVKNQYHFIFCVLLFLYYWFTTRVYGSPRVPMALFCVFTLFAFILPNICVVDTKILLKAMMFYPFFAILRLDLIFQTVTDWQDFINMDASYSFLIPVVANMVFLLNYFKEESKKEKILTIVLSLINSVYLMRLLIFGSRGVILSLILVVVFWWITDVKKEGGIIWIKKRILIVFLSLIATTFSYLTFFSALNDFLTDMFGYKFYAIDKIVDLGKQGDLANGRNYISEACVNGIMDSPIWGNGLDRFGPNTQLVYPHNFVLQILYDGGILFFFLMLVPIVKAIKVKIKRIKKDEFSLLITFFFASVPGALFSNDMYEIPLLWMTFGFILTNGFVYERNNKINYVRSK